MVERSSDSSTLREIKYYQLAVVKMPFPIHSLIFALCEKFVYKDIARKIWKLQKRICLQILFWWRQQNRSVGKLNFLTEMEIWRSLGIFYKWIWNKIVKLIDFCNFWSRAKHFFSECWENRYRIQIYKALFSKWLVTLSNVYFETLVMSRTKALILSWL